MVLEDLRAVTPDGQTFSAGLAEWDGREDPERLVGRADRALYEAKHAGRDRIIEATAPPDPPQPPATSPPQTETAPSPTQIDTKTTH
jgi:hypothetical protein